MNKKLIKNIIICVGIAVGILSIIFGIIVICETNYHIYGSIGTASTTIKFGADYYTETYQAVATANNALYNIFNLIENVIVPAFGYLLIIIGASISVKYGLSLAENLCTGKLKTTEENKNN